MHALTETRSSYLIARSLASLLLAHIALIACDEPQRQAQDPQDQEESIDAALDRPSDDSAVGADAALLDQSAQVDAGRPDAQTPDLEMLDMNLVDAGLDEGVDIIDVGLSDMLAPDMAPVEEVPCVQPISQLEFVVWPTVFADNCITCHLPGDFAAAGGSMFILHDPDNPQRESRAEAFSFNLDQINAFRNDMDGEPHLIPKALGQKDHGGLVRIAEGGEAHQTLIDFFDLVDRAEDPTCTETVDEVVGYQEVMDRLEIMTPQETFRSFTVQVLGRLPTAQEERRIEQNLSFDTEESQENERRPDTISDRALNHESNELRVVYQMIGERLRQPEAKAWLKEAWNEVFMFRGVYAQTLARPYEVFNPKDYGARHWSDMCDVRVFEKDERGEWIIGRGRQPLCDLEHEQFNFPSVVQPNPSGSGYRAQSRLSPAEACDYCLFTRHGVAEWMLYGAVEEPLELIADVIQSGAPFSEIVTTQDVMMNYYTSLVYFGTADPAENDFTADMSDVPTRTEHRNGEDWVKFEVELPEHTHFKRLNRIRRTKQDTRWITYTFINANDEEETESGSHRDITFATALDPNSYDEFPRAGILTTPAFFARFPSNEFNLHRHRAWQVLKLFLDYDVLTNQGERLSLADVEDPNAGATRNQTECAGCHTVLDPVAGLFKDFHTDSSSLSPADADRDWPGELSIHQPAWPSIDGGQSQAHGNDRPRQPPIRLLAEQLVAHHRFAPTMMKHAWAQVMGSPRPVVSIDPADEHFQARSTLMIAQDRFMDSLARTFDSTDMSMITAYQRLFTSRWYRIKRLKPEGAEMIPDYVYADVGRHGTITPEEYMRRLEAVYGDPWPLRRPTVYESRSVTEEERIKRAFFTRTDTAGLDSNRFDLKYGLIDQTLASFFGGIDFQNTLTRAEQTNAVMSLLTRRVANEFACLVVYRDLSQSSRPSLPQPTLSPRLIDQRVVNDAGTVNQRALQANLIALIKRILNREVTGADADVDLARNLWAEARSAALLDDEAGEGGISQYCRVHDSSERATGLGSADDDPQGEARAWMAVLTYLLLQPEFLQR